LGTRTEQWRAQIEQRNRKMKLKIGQHKQDPKHDFSIGIQQVYNQFIEVTVLPHLIGTKKTRACLISTLKTKK
jgi:hypothetical protein